MNVSPEYEYRYLLLQARDEDDPMRGHEVAAFTRALGCAAERIAVVDLLKLKPRQADVQAADVVLLGGSGDYSVAQGGPWLEPAMLLMQELVDLGKPTFASCWGFQLIARAIGGQVVTDLSRAELGSIPMRLTDAGREDPVFGPLAEAGSTFRAQSGHQDIVDRLPDSAVCLASTDLVRNEAFTIVGKPIYCTQFHPELDRAGLIARLEQYPAYCERIAGMPLSEFESQCVETPEANRLLKRFVDVVCGCAS